jgi:pumilio homology domain family member 6
VVDPSLDFASRLYATIKSSLIEWATGEGSFVVVGLLDALSGKEKDELNLQLKSNKKLLEQKASENKGTKILLETLA